MSPVEIEEVCDATEKVCHATRAALRLDGPHSRLDSQSQITVQQMYLTVDMVLQDRGLNLGELLDGNGSAGLLPRRVNGVKPPFPKAGQTRGETLTWNQLIALDVPFGAAQSKIDRLHQILFEVCFEQLMAKVDTAFQTNRGTKYASTKSALARARAVYRQNAIPRNQKNGRGKPSPPTFDFLFEVAMAIGVDWTTLIPGSVDVLAEVVRRLANGAISLEDAKAFAIYKLKARSRHRHALDDEALRRTRSDVPDRSLADLRRVILRAAELVGAELTLLSADCSTLTELFANLEQP